jgi:hypothetical protein
MLLIARLLAPGRDRGCKHDGIDGAGIAAAMYSDTGSLPHVLDRLSAQKEAAAAPTSSRSNEREDVLGGISGRVDLVVIFI